MGDLLVSGASEDPVGHALNLGDEVQRMTLLYFGAGEQTPPDGGDCLSPTATRGTSGLRREPAGSPNWLKPDVCFGLEDDVGVASKT
jgi:hypothetical protein